MAVVTYPGVYVEEIPSGVRTITGVSTSTTAFVGRTLKGPIDRPVEIHSFGEFTSIFGGLWEESPLSFSVQQFFMNGGQTAVIVRLVRGDTVARFAVPGAGGNLVLDASSPGTWGNNLTIAVDTATADPANLFNITVRDPAPPGGVGSGDSEVLRNLSANPASPRYLKPLLAQQSRFLRLTSADADVKKPATTGQLVTISGSPTNGTFTLTLPWLGASGLTTAAIARNATAAAVKSALTALAGLNTADVEVSGGPGPGQPYVVKFVGPFAGQTLPLMQATSAFTPPTASAAVTANLVTSKSTGSTAAVAGSALQDLDVNPASGPTGKKGMYLLEDQDIFNILVIPPLDLEVDVDEGTWAAAAVYCRDRRAFLIVDPPAGTIAPPANSKSSGLAALADALPTGNPEAQYAAYFFPRFIANNSLTGLPQEFAPSGAIAGVMARTDATRGVWKAPAGLEAGITGAIALSYPLTDGENGTLNQLGVNCLRTFNLIGSVIWGSRTLQGSDALASEWKYIPVRRLALFIEESLFRGTQWVVFEPNDEPLWSQIRLNLGAFMHNLFRQGAFQGASPRDAYFVKCDSETTTQNDINLGIVNILVGFAPLKPAEFVVIKIQQMAGQVQA